MDRLLEISIDAIFKKIFKTQSLLFPKNARVAELADALDLGSSGKTMRVRVPPLAPDLTLKKANFLAFKKGLSS